MALKQCLVETQELISLLNEVQQLDDSHILNNKKVLYNTVALYKATNNTSTIPDAEFIINYYNTLSDNELLILNDPNVLKNKVSIEANKKADIELGDKRRARGVLIYQKLREALYNLVGDKEFNITSLKESLKTKSIKDILNSIQEDFINYISIPEEETTNFIYDSYIQYYDDIIIERSDIIRPSDEDLLNRAKEKDRYKRNEFRKIIDNFWILAQDASMFLEDNEGLIINSTTFDIFNPNRKEDIEEDNDNDTILDYEETSKESWMIKQRNVSSVSRLSQEVRNIIGTIPKIDEDGYFIEDDLGNTSYLDSDYVHNILIKGLSKAYSSEDFYPILEEIAKEHIWAEDMIVLLKENPLLESKFIHNYSVETTQYWTHISKEINGVKNVKTFWANNTNIDDILFKDISSNLENSTVLINSSIYNNNGTINKSNIDSLYKRINSAYNKLKELSKEELKKELEKNPKGYIRAISDVLKSIGVFVEDNIINDVLFKDYSNSNVQTEPNIISILDNVKHILINTHKKLNNSIELIEEFNSRYKYFSKLFSKKDDINIEPSIRINNRNYYSYGASSYLGTLLKKLSNKLPNKAHDKKYNSYFEQFLYEEFKKYDFFYKNGKNRNNIIELLESNEKIRNNLEHKVVLTFNNKEYSSWQSKEYAELLINEYFSLGENRNNSINYGYYYVPIMAEVESAEFIKFRKYIGREERLEDGSYKSIEDTFTDLFYELLNQEYDRINLVRKRDFKRQKGEQINFIANYDIQRDSKGNIKNLGGAMFKFMPFLNITYIDGLSVLSYLDKAAKNDTITLKEIERKVKKALKEKLQEEFEKEYNKYRNLNILEENNNGINKILKVQGEKKMIELNIKALESAKELLLPLNLWNETRESLLLSYKQNDLKSDRDVQDIFKYIEDDLSLHFLVGNDMRKKNIANRIINSFTTNNMAKNKLKEYFYNTTYFNSQFIQLVVTDIAFFKNLADFQKRFKQIHPPSPKLNLGMEGTKSSENVMYLKDNIVFSKAINEIKNILGNDTEKLDKYKEVNSTDAQSFRTLSSYREVKKMMGDWGEKEENAYNNFRNGIYKDEDFNIIYQTIKPFLSGNIGLYSGFDNKDIRVPIQHKNSELVLLPNIPSNTIIQNSPILKALNDFMESHNIDVVHFESAVKVGKTGLIDITDEAIKEYTNKGISIEEAVKTLLKEQALDKSGGLNKNVVHNISYELYGKQTETPEHHLDKKQLIPTQQRKLALADLTDDFKIDLETEYIVLGDTKLNLESNKLNKQQLYNLYNDLIIAGIEEKFNSLRSIFKDNRQLEAILLSEIKGNSRYSKELIKACSLDEFGNFNLPLQDPIQSIRIQQLLTSIIKSRITKQKIKGGSLIQASSYGLREDLSIIFKDSNGDEISYDLYKKNIDPTATREDYSKYINNKYKKGELSISKLECVMPIYDTSLYNILKDKDSHTLDINKLPEELRKIVVTRVPTEDKYSMLPLYIKEFSTQQNGSVIYLPHEITTITGSDFDKDVMYFIAPEFKIIKYYDKYAFAKDYLNQLGFKGNFKEGMEDVVNSINKGKEADEGSKERLIYDTYIANRENYRNSNKDKIIPIKYDFSKSAKGNKSAARNNLYQTLLYKILTSKEVAPRVLNPGGFDKQKKGAAIMDIILNINTNTLIDIFKENNIEVDRNNVYDELLKLPLSYFDKNKLTLSNITDRIELNLNPLSPYTQVHLHNENMAGANLIGIYANHNSNNAMMQYTNLEINPDYAFTINGKRYTSLSSIKNEQGEYISSLVTGYLSASVDNIKDRVLAKLFQNTFTANSAMLMARLGYSVEEVGFFFNQPIIKDITEKFFLKGGNVNRLINNIMSEYIERNSNAYIPNKNLINTIKQYNFTNKFFIENMLNKDKTDVDFIKNQLLVATLFKNIYKASEALNELVNITKADTPKGASGPTLADTLVKIFRYNKFVKDRQELDFPLKNTEDILPAIDEEFNSESISKSKIPYMTAFNYYGIFESTKFFDRFFPHNNTSVVKLLDRLTNITQRKSLTSKEINNILNQLYQYAVLTINDVNKSEEGYDLNTLIETRDYYINKFPVEFVKKVKNIKNSELIKRLYVVKDKTTNLDKIVFKSGSKLSIKLSDIITKDWLSLYNTDNRQLAIDLFLYNFYYSGLAFTPNSFNHLSPMEIRKDMGGYISTLNKMLEPFNEDFFFEQFIYNNADNTTFVPNISIDGELKIDKEEDGLILNIEEDNPIYQEYYNKFKTEEDFPIYISVSDNNGTHYFELHYYNPEYNIIGYRKFNKLGKETIKEYVPNARASDLISMFKENNTNLEINKEEFKAEIGNRKDNAESTITLVDYNGEYLDSDNKKIC